jgi:hypothetical protein
MIAVLRRQENFGEVHQVTSISKKDKKYLRVNKPFGT